MSAFVDLRSDTQTRPSPGMRTAMAQAEVGDDVYGEDPTINALEARVAELFGHEAALFVPSGTMGNQICLRLLVPPADELLCDADAHIVTYEAGAPAQLGGIQTRTLVSDRGLLDPDAVQAQLRPPGFGTVVTKAVAVENTHNRGGGAVYPYEQLVALRSLTAGAGVALHCDGARLWNASVASGVALRDYGSLFDTMSVCLSKGLGAPVGSVLVASAERVAQARVLRKRLGGGMRQAGILAAAGLYALDHNVERLADDHRRARRVAEDLQPYGVTDPAAVETNVVVVNLAATSWAAAELAAAAREQGVLVSVVGPQRLRLLTHLDVDDDGCALAVKALTGLLG